MKKPVRIIASIILLTTLLLVIVIKVQPTAPVYPYSGGSNLQIIDPSGTTPENKVETLEKSETPVYYTVFKFILNFIPLPTNQELSLKQSAHQALSLVSSFV